MARRGVIVPQRSIHYELFFHCKLCQSAFPTYTSLSFHLELHAESRSMLQEHSLGSNGAGERRRFERDGHECSICGMMFKRGQALGGHMKSHGCRWSKEARGKKATFGKSAATASTGGGGAIPSTGDDGCMVDFDLNELPVEMEDDGKIGHPILM